MPDSDSIKHEILWWIDNHGVDTSRDILTLLLIFTVLTYLINNTSGLPTISALTLFKTTTFGTLIAFIFYAAAKPKWDDSNGS